MEEILYELREHSSGLNAGRWDYIFSVIKKFRTRGREFLLPDRAQVTMTVPFMHAYSELLVASCHKRGAHAIGGMAAFIPSRDPVVNEAAFGKVEEDKAREAGAGFDGSWVAHPGMVEVCKGGVHRGARRATQPVRQASRGRSRHRRTAAGRRRDARRGDRGRASQQRQRRYPVPCVLVARNRSGGHLQPHGGHGHSGDLALAGVAVAAQRHRPRRHRPGGEPRAGRAHR